MKLFKRFPKLAVVTILGGILFSFLIGLLIGIEIIVWRNNRSVRLTTYEQDMVVVDKLRGFIVQNNEPKHIFPNIASKRPNWNGFLKEIHRPRYLYIKSLLEKGDFYLAKSSSRRRIDLYFSNSSLMKNDTILIYVNDNGEVVKITLTNAGHPVKSLPNDWWGMIN